MKKLFAILLVFILLIASSLCVNAETPELPENNKLLSDEWVKGLGKTTVTKETIDGEDVYTMSKIDTTYSSAYLDIYPTIKALMGDESEVSVYIVLDVRVVNTEENSGEPFPFGMKIRPKCTELTKSQEAFNENYATESDTFKHQYGSVNVTAVSGKTATEEWQRIEAFKIFVDVDINDKFWTEWNLCFDVMSNFANGASLQVKNAAIYLEDDYEPIEKDEDKDSEKDQVKPEKYITPVTPAPAKINKPYYFDKYSVTFLETFDSVDSSGDDVINDQVDTGKTQVYIIIGASVLGVLVVAGVVILIIKKNKKKGSEE